MHDKEIIQMYWDRDEKAIAATSEKYGPYCQTIAMNILGNWEDAEECFFIGTDKKKKRDFCPPVLVCRQR